MSPFDGGLPRRETRSVVAKKTAKSKPKALSKQGSDEAPLPQDVLNAVEVMYHQALHGRGTGRRSMALAAIAEALEHIVEHDDNEGWKALDHLAKEARKYTRKHACYRELGNHPRPPDIIEAPTRPELIKNLVAGVEECRKNPRLSVERFLIARLLYGSAPGTIGVYPTDGFLERVRREVQEAITDRVDAEGIVVAALIGWGLTRRRARDWVKSAMKRSR